MTSALSEDLKKYIRDIPDFPKKGILYRDITTLLSNPEAFNKSIDSLANRFKESGITKVVGIESRGFLTAAPLAYILKIGLIPVRKKGKLPFQTHAISYELEYGKDTLEIHVDAIESGDKILIADDLLATGGTAKAACSLIEKNGGVVAGLAFIIELTNLNGRKKVGPYEIASVIKY